MLSKSMFTKINEQKYITAFILEQQYIMLGILFWRRAAHVVSVKQKKQKKHVEASLHALSPELHSKF